MLMLPEVLEISPFLEETAIVDFSNLDELAHVPCGDSVIETAKSIYIYVRDQISHSADIGNDELTWIASEVQSKGHGVCFAKSNLLVALLRKYGIPAGFCYQQLIFDDETAPYLIYHGLVAVHFDGRWTRIDARGNTPDINAEFSLDKEKLAYSVRSEWHEADLPTVYAAPAPGIQAAFARSDNRDSLWTNLPKSLDCKGDV